MAFSPVARIGAALARKTEDGAGGREFADFRALAKEALPAVVNITVEQKVKLSRHETRGGGESDDLDEFYGPRLRRATPAARAAQQEPRLRVRH